MKSCGNVDQVHPVTNRRVHGLTHPRTQVAKQWRRELLEVHAFERRAQRQNPRGEREATGGRRFLADVAETHQGVHEPPGRRLGLFGMSGQSVQVHLRPVLGKGLQDRESVRERRDKLARANPGHGQRVRHPRHSGERNVISHGTDGAYRAVYGLSIVAASSVAVSS